VELVHVLDSTFDTHEHLFASLNESPKFSYMSLQNLKNIKKYINLYNFFKKRNL